MEHSKIFSVLSILERYLHSYGTSTFNHDH